jgi:hypothetical protein
MNTDGYAQLTPATTGCKLRTRRVETPPAYNQRVESLSEAALAYARECLNRPNSRLVDDEIQTGEEFNLGPPGYLDATSFELYDLQRIMQMVTSWCRHHGLDLTLRYFDGSYACHITVVRDGKLSEIIEFRDHEVEHEAFAPCVDACYVLLAACVQARRRVRSIVQFYDSLE